MKKLLVIALALTMALLAMSVTAFAEDVVLFDNPEGQQVTNTFDFWDAFGVGWIQVNGAYVGEIPLEDVVAHAEAGATLVMVYSTSNPDETYPELEFNVWEAEEHTESVYLTLTPNDDGTITGVVNLKEVLDNYIAYGGSVDSIGNCGLQVWSHDFMLHKLYITYDPPVIEAPAEEAPVEEAPAEEAPAEEAPAEEEDSEPADTGVALAAIPAVVALVAVVVSKKR